MLSQTDPNGVLHQLLEQLFLAFVTHRLLRFIVTKQQLLIKALTHWQSDTLIHSTPNNTTAQQFLSKALTHWQSDTLIHSTTNNTTAQQLLIKALTHWQSDTLTHSTTNNTADTNCLTAAAQRFLYCSSSLHCTSKSCSLCCCCCCC